jgi:hypothetical protein
MQAMNDIHDIIIDSSFLGKYSDKQLHFIIIGIIGIIIFAATQLLFKWLAKRSITAISFIYTITVLIVLVFGIEIQQKITGRGNMEFNDILAGIYGFMYIFFFYLVVKLLIYVIKKYIFGNKEKTKLSR